MPPRVIFDNSAILNGLTPVPQRGSIIWHWMQTEAVQAITSDHLVIELTKTLAHPRFRLDAEAQATIVAEYLQYAELFELVPSSGASCRDPKDIPVLDLAIWQRVDAIVSAGSGPPRARRRVQIPHPQGSRPPSHAEGLSS